MYKKCSLCKHKTYVLPEVPMLAPFLFCKLKDKNINYPRLSAIFCTEYKAKEV